MIFGSALRLTVKKEISSDRNWREVFWGAALWCVYSTQGVVPLSHKTVFEHCSCKPEKVIFHSALNSMVKSEISSNKTQKEGFQETALWYVHSFHRVKRTLHCTVWKLYLWGICEGILSGTPVACGEQGNVFQWKLERSFLSNCFVMCIFIL